LRGRSPFNNKYTRKKDVYELLLTLGGEARWKDLKMNLKKLGWGPTTLKKTLDAMVEEGSLVKEARLGAKGPEAWYKVKIKDSDIWEPLEVGVHEGKPVSVREIAQRIRERSKTLQGEEKEVFLKNQMRRVVEITTDTLCAFLYMQARGALKLGKSESLKMFDYVFDVILKKQMKEHTEMLLDHPRHSMEILLNILIRDKDKREEALRLEGLKK
jgi:hypothetical protein